MPANVNMVLILGEKLSDRLWLHQKFFNSFVCSKAVTWLMEKHKFPNREHALLAWRLLQIHHVVHPIQQTLFNDDDTLARFTCDEGDHRNTDDLQLAQKAQLMEDKLYSTSNGILTVFHEPSSGEPFFAFTGSSILNWMCNTGNAANREEANNTCRKMLQNEIIRHVEDRHQFKDSADIFYRFHPDFNSETTLLQLVEVIQRERKRTTSRCVSETECSTPNPASIPTEEGSESRRRTLTPPESPKYAIEMWKDSQAGFSKKVIKIKSDSVGYGFVVRGNGPSFIQTVDPSGPGANAGLKVGHIIQKVNNQEVIHMHHKDAAKVILGTALGTITLTVLEAPEPTPDPDSG